MTPEEILSNDLDTALLAFAIGGATTIPVLMMRTSLPPAGEQIVLGSGLTKQYIGKFDRTHMASRGDGAASTYSTEGMQVVTNATFEVVTVAEDVDKMPHFMRLDDAWMWTIFMRIAESMRSRSGFGTSDRIMREIVRSADRVHEVAPIARQLEDLKTKYADHLNDPRVAGLIHASMAVHCTRMGTHSLREVGFDPWRVIAGFKDASEALLLGP